MNCLNKCKDYLCINARTCLKKDLKEPKQYCIINTYKPKRVQVLVDNGHEPICQCCLTEFNLTFDHITPLSKGGLDDNDNGQILCRHCNSLKANKIITIPELIIYRRQTTNFR